MTSANDGPPALLKKADLLTDAEPKLIRRHAQWGFEDLAVNEKLGDGTLMMVYQHHERINGIGYPVQLAGDDVHPFGADLCSGGGVRFAYFTPALSSSKVNQQRAGFYRTQSWNLVSTGGGLMLDQVDPADLISQLLCRIELPEAWKEYFSVAERCHLYSTIDGGIRGIIVVTPRCF